MSPPNPPRSPMESIVEAAVARAVAGLARDLEDAQRQIRELQGVDEQHDKTIAAATQRLTTHSGTHRDLLGNVAKVEATGDERQRANEAAIARIETMVRTQLGQAGIAQGMIKTAATNAQLAENRSADVVVAQNSARLAIEGMRWKIIAGAVVSIVLGITTIAANTIVTLKRSAELEQHIDERLHQAAPK